MFILLGPQYKLMSQKTETKITLQSQDSVLSHERITSAADQSFIVISAINLPQGQTNRFNFAS